MHTFYLVDHIVMGRAVQSKLVKTKIQCCIAYWRPVISNDQPSIRSDGDLNPDPSGGRQMCDHYTTMVPFDNIYMHDIETSL